MVNYTTQTMFYATIATSKIRIEFNEKEYSLER